MLKDCADASCADAVDWDALAASQRLLVAGPVGLPTPIGVAPTAGGSQGNWQTARALRTRVFSEQLAKRLQQRACVLFSPTCGAVGAAHLAHGVGPGGMVLRQMLERGPVWLILNGARPTDWALLEQVLRIHPVLVAAGREGDDGTGVVTERCELVERFLMVSFEAAPRELAQDVGESPRGGVTCLVSRELLVTCYSGAFLALQRVIVRLYSEVGRTSLNPLWTMLQLLSEQLGAVQDVVERLERNTALLDERVFAGEAQWQATFPTAAQRQDSFLVAINGQRRHAGALLRYLTQKTALVKHLQRVWRDVAIAGRSQHWLAALWLPPVARHSAALQDRLAIRHRALEHTEDMLLRSYSTYLAELSLELIHSSRRINNVLTHVTLFAGFFGPLSLTGAIFGMNVAVPLQTLPNSASFMAIWVGVASLTGLAFWAVLRPRL